MGREKAFLEDLRSLPGAANAMCKQLWCDGCPTRFEHRAGGGQSDLSRVSRGEDDSGDRRGGQVFLLLGRIGQEALVNETVSQCDGERRKSEALGGRLHFSDLCRIREDDGGDACVTERCGASKHTGIEEIAVVVQAMETDCGEPDSLTRLDADLFQVYRANERVQEGSHERVRDVLRPSFLEAGGRQWRQLNGDI